MSTTTVNISRARVQGRERETMRGLIGRRGATTLFDGTRVEGTIEGPARGSDLYLTLRLDDGRWTRLDDLVDVVA